MLSSAQFFCCKPKYDVMWSRYVGQEDILLKYISSPIFDTVMVVLRFLEVDFKKSVGCFICRSFSRIVKLRNWGHNPNLVLGQHS